MTLRERLPDISRRKLLIGGGIGAGLVIAWGLWPRSYRHNLLARPGESIFNAFLKIDETGLVTVVVPQAEMGQGVYTSLPQILADELGADWRTIAVEPAPINALYANDFLIRDGMTEALPVALQGMGRWASREIAYRSRLMVTGGSTSIRGFADRFREAGAAARTLLCMAAAERWDADWRACDTHDGFVTRGEPGETQERLRFGELAVLAASFQPPEDIPLRDRSARTLVNRNVPRLDLPAKVDGSAQYAMDIRLPGMVFASVRHPPISGGRLKSLNRKATEKVAGVIALVENPLFVAAIAENWWAAEQALVRAAPKWVVDKPEINDAAIVQVLKNALDRGDGSRVMERGDAHDAFGDAIVMTAEYRVGFAPHAAMEPLNATARYESDRLEVWMPTQSLTAARAAIARATGLKEEMITVHPMLIGGGFGRKSDNDAAIEAAILAIKCGRPVQLTWPRSQDLARNRCRPPALARMRARIEPNSGTPIAWQARIACPSTITEFSARTAPETAPFTRQHQPSAPDVDGAMPPYAVPAVAVDHLPVDTGIPTSFWRSVSHSYTAFFTECFIDELAHLRKMDPMSYRMQLLGNEPRLAECLSLAAAHAGWQGGSVGTGQGIACHSSYGSHVAMVADIHVREDQRIIVDRVTAVVDCGEVIHPDIVRQQVEGGIIWGIAATLGCQMRYEHGQAVVTNFDGLMLPTLVDSPEIAVHILPSVRSSGGVGEIAVPPVAPAIANALYATTGKRLRTLPLNG